MCRGFEPLTPVCGTYHDSELASAKIADFPMKPWKQYLLLNSVAVAGIVWSIFVLPGNTPVRIWAAISGCAVATLNVALYRCLNRPKTSFLRVAPYFCLAILIAEGGWQQYVAYVAIAVAALIGAILWFAKKTIQEN